MLPLPIDPQIPPALDRLVAHGALVLTAPPGAGKSTRLPPALLARTTGQVYLLQPRRVAARALARRIAAEQGWELGREVGWRIRFEKLGGAHTRLWVMTEGTLTRQLQSDPYLDGVGAVILDEFHERSLHTDLCLAWCAELRRTVRPDLRVVVMSATMDAAPIARFLGDAPIVAVQTPTYPVAITTIGRGDRRLEDEVLAAVSNAIDDADCGDVLVFLPGTGEIRGCEHALEPLAQSRGFAVLPLHGALPPEQQDAALQPHPQGRRKVVLATNVAETSVTIPGVRTVIDSGLARVARFAADTGLDELHLERISRASATQRAGRAGRTAPGRCWRLWTRLEENRLVEQADPEIARVDLAPTLLALKGWHGADPRTFPWFVRPDDDRLLAGEQLLTLLGAAREPFAGLTALGERLARLPVHPRLGRLLDEATRAGAGALGAALAALVGERDIRPPSRPGERAPDPDRADALDRLERLARAESAGFRPSLRGEGIDPIAAREAVRVRDDLLRLVAHGNGPRATTPPDAAVLVPRLLLAAYPDRVAKRTSTTSNRAAMVGGVSFEIDRASCCLALPGQARGELLLAYQVQGLSNRARTSTFARQCAELDESDLEAVFPGTLKRRELLTWDDQRQAVSAIVGWYWHDLCLRVAPGAQADPARIGAFLAEQLRQQARALFAEDEAVGGWLARLAWLRRQMPELDLPEIDDTRLGDLLDQLCAGCRSRAEVAAKPKLPWLSGQLSHQQNRALDELAPAHWTVPTGNAIRLQYDDPERPPVLAVRLQELFGEGETPRLAGGRVPVLLHLLGPNYRAEQITQDLASFWANTYPQVRKDLRSRYPKHSWPDDPLSAPPVARGRPRR